MSYHLELTDPYKTEIETNVSLRKMADRLYMKSESVPTVRSYLNDVNCFARWMKLKPDELIKGQFDWPALRPFERQGLRSLPGGQRSSFF